uniref:PiggyBac transposable element-derived protein domain-containing protein n=1 Tax=Glossina austeni TaxID=7395 RepID=A0A1A9VJC8_GLOAU
MAPRNTPIWYSFVIDSLLFNNTYAVQCLYCNLWSCQVRQDKETIKRAGHVRQDKETIKRAGHNFTCIRNMASLPVLLLGISKLTKWDEKPHYALTLDAAFMDDSFVHKVRKRFRNEAFCCENNLHEKYIKMFTHTCTKNLKLKTLKFLPKLNKLLFASMTDNLSFALNAVKYKTIHYNLSEIMVGNS